MSPSGKAAVFGTAISEVRVLPPQNIKDLSSDGSFLMFWNGVLSPPSFHSRRSFKRGSTLSGILPRTAHVVRLRCRRVLTTQNIKPIVRLVFFNAPGWIPLPSKFSLPQVVQTRFYPVGVSCLVRLMLFAYDASES